MIQQLNLYTDASLGNDPKANVAGIGVVIENPENEDRWVLSDYLEKCDDINVAEMYAIYYALKVCKENKLKAKLIRLVVDNKTCVDLLTNQIQIFNEGVEYSKDQKRRKLELKKWYSAVKAYAKNQDIKISHISGHRAYFNRYNTNNALADVLSRDGIRKWLDVHKRKDTRYQRNDSWKNKKSGRIE